VVDLTQGLLSPVVVDQYLVRIRVRVRVRVRMRVRVRVRVVD
jgi:hypothetical protein